MGQIKVVQGPVGRAKLREPAEAGADPVTADLDARRQLDARPQIGGSGEPVSIHEREAPMTRGFEAIKTISIDASRARVWDTLTDPAKIARWLHGTTVSTDWFVGSPITWSGEWDGKRYVDKGTVLEFDPEIRLRTTHWSPLGGSEDRPENYHTVTYDLAGHDQQTLLTLTQDNNASQAEADEMADANWGPVLVQLKATAERA